MTNRLLTSYFFKNRVKSQYSHKHILRNFIEFSKNIFHESIVILTRFCEKIGGLGIISSLSNQTCTSISSYFLYFWCFQSKFTTVYPLILLIFQKELLMRVESVISSSMLFRHQIKLALVYLLIFCIFDVLKTNLQ